MARKLRLEFPGALFHVTSRGNERRDIFLDDRDRLTFLELLGEAVERFRWIVYQYVLMTNHFHFVFELSSETLSKGMKWFNSQYAERFNRRHRRVGHLFQGRFDSRLVQKEAYLLEVLRYDALNPVRAKMVARPEQYQWSGHCGIAGLAKAPEWLAVDRVLRCFAPNDELARIYYARFVDEGIGVVRSPWEDLVGDMYLGEPRWVETMQSKVAAKPRCDEFPLRQRRPVTLNMADVIAVVASAVSMSEASIRFGRGGSERMLAAWLGCYAAELDYRSIAASLRLRSRGGVSKMIKECEQRLRADPRLRDLVSRCTESLHPV